MTIVKKAVAGTMESSDIMIVVDKPEGEGIHITLESPVKKQFGDRIKEVILDSARKVGVKDADIKAIDKGALDCVIMARATTALYRACESIDYQWEK
ncbi:citrate lyase acyl carrier protein [Sediminispirochaeta bajacaliforniensis]|uniref:citrate lyase acyl carrier protein n=1 Tax=Sediminispirochaeta bajacaliforniensis TaxID=148 RepID=UPI000378B251|nr:citrate lyase acyl carrier protein [Sediminispirochaeta bajacaliforniensis]